MPEGFLLLNSRLSSNDVKEIRAALKAAYQRGREDAANASDEALRKAGGEPQPAGADDPYSFANGFTYAGLIAVAAARGDGNHE